MRKNLNWHEDGRLHFGLGIEDTFIPQERAGERSLDEYELTQHYRFWHQDLGLAKEAGAEFLRWGIPWYKINPERDVWKWDWLDQVMDRFQELGLKPLVDLMHYGTPTWLDNQFLNSSYPERVADYSARVAARYADTVVDYTPVNEPMIHTLFAGKFGHWPPYLAGDDGLVALVRNLSKGFVLAQQNMAEVLGERAIFTHVDAGFRFVSDSNNCEHDDELQHLKARSYLVEDLVTGKVDANHELTPWLSRHGMTDHDLAWHQENIVLPDVMGVNYYPLHSTELLESARPVRGDINDPRAVRNDWTEGLADVLTTYGKRYGAPVALTETCLTGSYERRIEWLDASVRCVQELRAAGQDIVGYTWWPVTDMYEWTYRYGTEPLEHYRLTMGLWDLVPDEIGTLHRVKNPVADRFQHYAAAAVTDPPAAITKEPAFASEQERSPWPQHA
ncbi:beta-glucosidase [Arthrobacter sp. 2762]